MEYQRVIFKVFLTLVIWSAAAVLDDPGLESPYNKDAKQDCESNPSKYKKIVFDLVAKSKQIFEDEDGDEDDYYTNPDLSQYA